MNNPTTRGGPSKMDVLKDVASIFYDFVKPYTTMQGDESGAVFFSNRAVPPDYLVDAMEVDAIDGVKNAIDGTNAGGSTSIGAGLKTAQDEGLDSFGPSGSNRKYALLLTDGRQNTAPFVNVENSTLFIDGMPFPTDTKVWVVSIGPESAARTDFNNRIAEAGSEEAAFSIQQLPGTLGAEQQNAFIQSFLNVAADAVIGDKTEQVATRVGTARANRAQAERFTLSEQDILLSLVVSWTNPQASDVRVTLTAPDSTDVPLAPYATRGERHLVAHVPLPLRRRPGTPVAGEWTASVLSEGVDTQYSLIAYGDNRSIVTEYGRGPQAALTGGSIPLQVSLQEAGQPITGAQVSARVRAPGASIGTVLAEMQVQMPSTGGERGEETRDDDTQDALLPAERKLQALVEQDPERYEQTLPAERGRITLSDPDGDGVYTANYADTQAHGTYEFDFEIEGRTPQNGAFTRARTYPVYVRSRPDPATTEVRARFVEADGRRALDVTVTPRDAVGNLLGPGYERFIQITAGGEERAGTPEDNLNGSFTQRFAEVEDDNTPITVRVAGVEVARGPASDFFE